MLILGQGTELAYNTSKALDGKWVYGIIKMQYASFICIGIYVRCSAGGRH